MMEVKKVDPHKGRFFLTLDEFHELPANTIISLKTEYDISFEGVESATISQSHWTYFGETVAHGNPKCKFSSQFRNEHPNYGVFRPKGSPHPMSIMTDSILECPFTRLVLYPAEDTTSKISKYRQQHSTQMVSPRPSQRAAANQVIVSVHRVSYRFPEITLLEKDYLRDLFQMLRERVYSEQEEAAASMKLSRSKMPVNQLIGRFVTEMELEEHHGHHYLTFTYEERGKIGNSKSPILGRSSKEARSSEVPLELELFADVPLEDDDSLNDSDEAGVVIDGEPYVRFALVLELYNSDPISASENQKP